MRVAVLSDIHGNVVALDACLADLRTRGGADVIVGAGDYCLDGPRPRAVLERLSALGATLVRGNTDRYVADGDPGLDDEEREQIAWQRKALGRSLVDRLRALPSSLRVGEGAGALLVVHAHPHADDEHVRPNAADAFLERATWGVSERTIAFGHLHVPYVRGWRDRTLVCVGSVGIPKDGDPRASYAILTRRGDGWEIVQRRVEFDVARVARDIRRRMPEAKTLVRTLQRHRYKNLDDILA